MTDLLEVGRVTKSHGVRGDVLVNFITDRGERWATGARLRVGEEWMEVRTARPHHDRHIVGFVGVADRNAADLLRGRTVWAEPIEDPDAIFVHEVVGSTVVDEDGTERGVVTSVIANPASDLLELDSGALVPLTFVTSQHDGRVTIDPPEGLFDLDGDD